jgi:hypothetical protein
MRLFEGISALETFPALHIEDLDTVVIADLHLGYETIASEHGVFIPRIQLNKTLHLMRGIVRRRKAKRAIILGDLKHEFLKTSYHEYREVSTFLDFLSRYFKEIVIVKGNHDTFIQRIARRYDIQVCDEFVEGRYLLLHGHRDIDIKRREQSIIILAHEHPSIALFTEVGVKEKLDCFLYGSVEGKKTIVLPAFSYFAEGSDVNLIPEAELLSPLLRKVGIDNLRVLALVENDRFLEFPSVGKLRRLYG